MLLRNHASIKVHWVKLFCCCMSNDQIFSRCSAAGICAAWGRIKSLIPALFLCAAPFVVRAQVAQPMVAIHDSELTRALETIPASGSTPTGSGTTGKQWGPTNWHYFVMPEAIKEVLRSDGTAFTVICDSNISSGALLADRAPRYSILI